MDSRRLRPRRKLRRALLVSLAGHAVAAGVLALLLNTPAMQSQVRRGEPLMVELASIPDPAPAGKPAARDPAPPSPPPAPRVAPPREAPPRKALPPIPPTAEAPAPAPPRPEPPRAVSAPPTPPPAPEPVAKAPEPAPAPPASPPAAEPRPPAPEGPRVATVPKDGGAAPPAPPVPPVPDLRTLKGSGGGGAGGRGGGWGGIEGEPLGLDSTDPKYNDYLDRIRRLIKANWGYPCVRDQATRECEYKSATLVVAFGILKDGRLQIVEVRRSSGLPIYDDYALNAIKLASPFPQVPPAMIQRGSAGLPILATFSYVVESSLTNVLR